ncbi:MAG: helix-turn-helix domain-containing protein [Fimbriimonas sp.]
MEIKKVLVHPVRSRLINILGGRRLTRAQLGEMAPEIPGPTLYRNLRILVDAGVVEEVERIPRGGSQEIVYSLGEGKAFVTPDEVARWSTGERLAVLDQFLNSISVGYRAYLAQGGEEQCPAMGVVLALSPEEHEALGRRLYAVVEEFVKLPPSAERKRYVLTVITQPDDVSGAKA